MPGSRSCLGDWAAPVWRHFKPLRTKNDTPRETTPSAPPQGAQPPPRVPEGGAGTPGGVEPRAPGGGARPWGGRTPRAGGEGKGRAPGGVERRAGTFPGGRRWNPARAGGAAHGRWGVRRWGGGGPSRCSNGRAHRGGLTSPPCARVRRAEEREGGGRGPTDVSGGGWRPRSPPRWPPRCSGTGAGGW